MYPTDWFKCYKQMWFCTSIKAASPGSGQPVTSANHRDKTEWTYKTGVLSSHFTWHPCTWESLYLPHPTSWKFPKCCLWYDFNVGLTDDSSSLSFQNTVISKLHRSSAYKVHPKNLPKQTKKRKIPQIRCSWIWGTSFKWSERVGTTFMSNWHKLRERRQQYAVLFTGMKQHRKYFGHCSRQYVNKKILICHATWSVR